MNVVARFMAVRIWARLGGVEGFCCPAAGWARLTRTANASTANAKHAELLAEPVVTSRHRPVFIFHAGYCVSISSRGQTPYQL